MSDCSECVSGTPPSVESPCSVADTLVCTSPFLLSLASPLSQVGEEMRTASPVSDQAWSDSTTLEAPQVTFRLDVLWSPSSPSSEAATIWYD